VLAEFYRKFPQMTTAVDPMTGQPCTPIFISAEHGDGLPDLMQRLRSHIPESKQDEYSKRKEKRLQRF
jgi:predicted GTPase